MGGSTTSSGMRTSQHPELAAQPVALPPLLLGLLLASFPFPDLPPSCAGTQHPAHPAAFGSLPSSTRIALSAARKLTKNTRLCW